MRILAHGGSSPENTEESYENVPQRGYDDGYGGYGTYGASPHGKGWHAEYGTDGRWMHDIGYGPLQQRPHSRTSYSQHAGACGTKGKGGKDSNVYIIQPGKGSGWMYPLRQKGGGKQKGKPSEEDSQEHGDGYSQGSSRSPSFAGAQRGWEARRLRREAASRSRSRPPQQVVKEEEADPVSPVPKAKARPVRASVQHELEEEGESTGTYVPEECYHCQEH